MPNGIFLKQSVESNPSKEQSPYEISIEPILFSSARGMVTVTAVTM
jgi:hypothetical protein